MNPSEEQAMRPLLWAAGGLLLTGTVAVLGEGKSGSPAKTTTEAKSVYDFTVQDIDAKDVKLSDYKGKVCLVVNVASK